MKFSKFWATTLKLKFGNSFSYSCNLEKAQIVVFKKGLAISVVITKACVSSVLIINVGKEKIWFVKNLIDLFIIEKTRGLVA